MNTVTFCLFVVDKLCDCRVVTPDCTIVCVTRKFYLKEITFKDIINALDANVLSNVYFNTRGDDDVMIRLIDNSLWSKMSSYLQEYAESITLAQLCDEYIKNNEIEHNIPMYYI